MEKLILQLALENAVKFKGKANPGAIIGKLIADNPKNKEKIKELQPTIKKTIEKVNSMTKESQIFELKIINPDFFKEKKKEKKQLKELKNAKDGEVTTRIPPEPSKYLHIGHVLSFIINYLYAEKYKGKCVLRFDDTNPEKAKQEYYTSIKEDLKWLNIKWDKEVIASEDMEKFYELAEKLIKENNAYICFCDREKISEFRSKGMICSCREKLTEVNQREWEDMLRGIYDEGECVLRLKGFMDSKNMVMRDPIIFRIVKTPHVLTRDKYVVWPMYDFECSVEEHLCGITHIMRSNEFGKMRIELQNYIQKLLDFNHQEYLQYSRFNIAGALTQGREIRKLIEEKKVTGWDDPQLVTVKALKRRGILPETFHELALEVGLSASDSNVDWSVIASINRKLLDPKVDRYFFVENPIEVEIKNAPETEAKLPLHPDKKGYRTFKTTKKFFLPEHKKGTTYRLMHLFNFKDNQFLSKEYNPTLDAKLIHWVPKEHVNVEILMSNGKIKKGIGEPTIKNIKIGETIQFERQFFARLESKDNNKYKFIFTHD